MATRTASTVSLISMTSVSRLPRGDRHNIDNQSIQTADYEIPQALRSGSECDNGKAFRIAPAGLDRDGGKFIFRTSVDGGSDGGMAARAREGRSEREQRYTTLEYPEGGLRAWMVVFGAWAGMCACFGQMNSIGTFQAYISANQLKQYSPSAVGWIFSLYVFLAFFCGIQIGPIFDARGPRVLVFLGSILNVTSLTLLGSCTKYWHFLVVYGVIGGIGTSLVFTPVIASVGHFFLLRRGLATGIATTGGSMGGIIFPLMLESLFPRVGFAWASRTMGLIALFLVIICNLMIRSRLPKTPLSLTSAFPDFRIFHDPVFTLTTAGVFLIEWGLFVPLAYFSSYALDHGVDSKLSYQLLAILNAGSFLGRCLPGFVADKLGRFNTMIVTVALCLITTFALWLPAGATVPTMIVYAVLFGFASGSNISLTAVCVGQLCKTENYGRYYATCYTIVSFGTLTGIPIAGQILTADGGQYWGLIIFTGACYAGGLAAFLGARVSAVGWSLKRVF